MADTIGSAIRRRRKMLGLSQNALSKRSKVPRVSIQRYETNVTMPTAVRVLEIAKALDTTVDNLIADTDREGF